MSALQIVLVFVGILVSQVALWGTVFLWLRRRNDRMLADLRAEITAAGDRLVVGPEPGVYRGGTQSRSQMKGNAVLVLTDRRIICRKLIGEPIEIMVSEIVGVREDKWFMSSYSGGHLHVILDLSDGSEVGFFVRDHAGWMQAIRAAHVQLV